NIIPCTEDYAGDLEDPMLSINPANSIVRNNVCYILDKEDGGIGISGTVVSMGTVENNHDITDLECAQIPGYASGDYTLTDDAEAYQLGFEKLPFDEMGRIKNK
ncbi:MAG: hypothetical protein IKV54_02950, partial [Clostridia bacterium]|nr:hypothetical protein [Clostridia bacterium]